MELEWDCASECIINDVVIEKLKGYQEVIIFGAGDSGSWAYGLLKRHGLKIKAFCDNCKKLWGRVKHGISIESFDNAVKKYPQAAICIASMWAEEILEQIRGCSPDLICKTFNILTSMAWETSEKCYESSEPEYIRDNQEKFEQLSRVLADEASKITLEGILNYRLTRNIGYLERIRSKGQKYLDHTVIPAPLLERASTGTIIDGGAFDGDSVEAFIHFLGKDEKALHIHCYEANRENIARLRQKLDSFAPHKIEIHESALWNSSGGKLYFEGQGEAGRITGEFSGRPNDVQINMELETNGVIAEKIDDTFYHDLRLIKLDIEGAERYALQGAKNTIERNRPVLAICAYHLQDDILVLSDFIRSALTGYKLYLRHYLLSAGDTILYGIPQ